MKQKNVVSEPIEVELTQSQINHMILEKLLKVGSELREKAGVYNDADPTSYYRLEGKIYMPVGFSKTKHGNQPGPEKVWFSWHDCTWGVRINFIREKRKTVHTGYFDRESKQYHNCSPEFMGMLRRIFIESAEFTEGVPDDDGIMTNPNACI